MSSADWMNMKSEAEAGASFGDYASCLEELTKCMNHQLDPEAAFEVMEIEVEVLVKLSNILGEDLTIQ
ncbi:hypothetical protein PanWU01x14_191100 [Parasponia andersonii]|uniref:Uncharacterized protein n=1 Tax=Parasponia andersonii TaxID=3476 RepID=A0A2P5C1R6_PARAD|nr:hypothetical protein PanWU01x14_191100 [Parasponia andersonii]